MDFFNHFKQRFLASKLLSLITVILLLLSVTLTIHIVQLQQEIRQHAGSPSCQDHIGADCDNNGKSCCSGLACVPKENGNGGKCVAVPTSIPPTSVPPALSPNAPSGTPLSPSEPSVTSGAADNSGSSTPSEQSSNSGGGWSPRPAGESSTTNPPAVKICTIHFDGPTQLIGTRLSPTAIRLNWWPTPSGADSQAIQYGLESGNPQWGLADVAGDTGQIVIDHLPVNSTIWAQVRAYRGNCYEDTGWISVGSVRQVGYVSTIPQQTAVPTPTITVQPTSIALHATFYSLSPTPVNPQVTKPFLIQATSNRPGSLLFIAILFVFILFFSKKKGKKKE